MRSMLLHHDTNINPLHYFSNIFETYIRYFGGGLVAKLCPTLVTPWTVARLFYPWDSPGKNTGVGCHFLFQGIFPTQELNPGLLHYRQIFYQLSYKESPLGILKKIDFSGAFLDL